MNLKLTGAQIVIRDWITEDFDSYRFWNSGHHSWMDYDGPYYPKMTAKQVELEIDNYSSEELATKKRFVIADKKTNLLIGTISWYWQSQESNWKSIGLAIYSEKNWGKGIGFDALKLWVTHLFQADKNLTRLDFRTWSGNIGMIKLAKKLGFQEEARFRNARIVEGKLYDSIGMGILKTEWHENLSD